MDTLGQLKTDVLNQNSQYVTCPYNPSHRILKARLQYHLVKCRRNVKQAVQEKQEEEKVICPLDATHHVNKDELAEHMKECPNRKIVDSERYAIESEVEPASSYKVPDMPPCEENWDDPSEQPYTYDPTPHLENQPILRTMHGATKSERKAFRQVERKKMNQFQSGKAMNTEEAAAAVGVTIVNGKYLGRGRGLNRAQLGQGSDGLGPAKNKVDLEKIVRDSVAPANTTEVLPLRPPKQQSIALRLAQSSLTNGFEDLSFSDDKSQSSSKRPEEGPKTEAPKIIKKPSTSQDWWNYSNASNKVPAQTINLEEYKSQREDSKLAARLGLTDDASLADDERARQFTYLDEDWQVQGRRGRVHRGGAAMAQNNRSLTKGRNW